MYLTSELVIAAFERLREREKFAKRGKERTSGLMVFLAFDEFSRALGVDNVLVDPDSAVGRENRETLTMYYSRLVVVQEIPGKHDWYVDNLGTINNSCKRSSAKKFSGDFLTVPLKRASDASQPQEWPRRPNPLLTLGVLCYGKRWGISRHEEWKKNIHEFLENRVSATPWTDLAIFVMRKEQFDGDLTLADSLRRLVDHKYSADVAKHWGDKIVSERLRFPTLGSWLQSDLPVFPGEPGGVSKSQISRDDDCDCEERVKALEREVDRLRLRLKRCTCVASSARNFD